MIHGRILSYLKLIFLTLLPAALLQCTDRKPLLDHGRWKLIPGLSDEFEGNALDTTKWYPYNPGWPGRQPAYFSKNNVLVKEGMMTLIARSEDLPDLPEGYHTFTTAAVQSKNRIKYGYFEIRFKPMDSRCSSSFWFYAIDPETWTEIDVFEICGKHPDTSWEKKLFATTHVFKTPEDGGNHWSDHAVWEAPFRLADRFMTVGLEWDEDKIIWYVDGQVIRRRDNTHWHQALTMNFDSETMPEWWGLPEPTDPTGLYEIDYIRSWRKVLK